MTTTLVVNEIFCSLQGESTFAGLPCIFVRLTGCNLRCAWCDTAYAFGEGASADLETVVDRVRALAGPFEGQVDLRRLPLVELTGGEPLLQASLLILIKVLADEGFTVLLETGGALDIGAVDPRAHIIMDLKCPGSGEESRNRWENLPRLKSTDEIKFVIASREDYEWAKQKVEAHHLASVCRVLFSWAEPLMASQQHKSLKPTPSAHSPISRRGLAESMLADALPVRFQVQMHKFIWPPDLRGV